MKWKVFQRIAFWVLVVANVLALVSGALLLWYPDGIFSAHAVGWSLIVLAITDTTYMVATHFGRRKR